MTVPTVVHKSDFGYLTGLITEEGPVQFRNVPYSKPTPRWQHSTPLDHLENDAEHPHDATQWGPIAPQDSTSIDFDFGLIQKDLPHDRTFRVSETECLNLVVTTPSMEAKNLPVMVWIHGGGFFVGCNAWPQYDLCRLVKYSTEIGKPVVGVSINYRLGLLGFLASSDIDTPDAAGNYGLMDQVTALKWIHRYISSFGGDPNNITLLGESAGSISVYLHLLRNEPLFSRAICMSGDPRLRQPQSLESNEQETYLPLLKSLGFPELPAADKVAALRRVSWEGLVQNSLNTRVFPTLSNGFVALQTDVKEQEKQAAQHFRWCKSWMTGDCAQDALAFFRGPPPKDLLESFIYAAREYLSAEEIDLVVDSYKIGSGPKIDGQIDYGLAQFASDARFYSPVVLSGLSAPSGADMRTYHILEANPFDGPLKGYATHVLDVALIFQNYREYLPPDTDSLARRIASHFLDFAHGSLDPTGNENAYQPRQVTVWGPLGQVREMAQRDYDTVERGGTFETIRKIGVDRCNSVLELYQFGRRS